MTRINTNVSSLTAQKTLAKSQSALQTSLTRLSTGLRINAGKDDPAGLIASEVLRSDMISTERAISNTQRANQMIATADSALGQVTSLLNDIRGLVTEAANEGGMSDDQIAANQIQIDSSLEALNRIAQTTTFQGKKLLDGSLDFVIAAGTHYDDVVVDMQVDQANLGTAGSMAIDVDITAAATKAEITNDGGFTATATATADLMFAASATVAISNTADSTNMDIRANSLDSRYDGATIAINLDAAALEAGAAYDEATNTLTLTFDGVAITAQDVVDAINAEGTFTASVAGADAGDILDEADNAALDTLDMAKIQVDAITAGPEYNNVSMLISDSLTGNIAPTAEYDEVARTLTINIDKTHATTLAEIVTAIDNEGTFNATLTAGGAITSPDLASTEVDLDVTANTDVSGGATLQGDVVLEIGGQSGTEVFNFKAGASINNLVDAVNLISDSTGVEATFTGNVMTLNSTEYGSNAYVSVNVISEESTGTFNTNLSARRDEGTDIDATINGMQATGKGNTFSLNTATLDLTTTVSDGSSTNFNFTITGGGGLFQIGPDVVSNQQARLGISSVNAARMRGTSGRLYELATGESASLANDTTKAAAIVDQVLNKVSSLRGRIGAFQRTTLETNMATLSDTYESLTEAESSIRDADFAKETASLTRAQILVQSGISVLGIANQNPQNVLALLR